MCSIVCVRWLNPITYNEIQLWESIIWSWTYLCLITYIIPIPISIGTVSFCLFFADSDSSDLERVEDYAKMCHNTWRSRRKNHCDIWLIRFKLETKKTNVLYLSTVDLHLLYSSSVVSILKKKSHKEQFQLAILILICNTYIRAKKSFFSSFCMDE